ncbi:MAG TPA: hypothetical protein VLG49_05425 [Rhabdochlamydiaceae bacterium]|nr:hypothetical protein [Rhabdochlamydiaceae bacterium]HSX13552.1 hypothetical protein [Chlamydiales bacterium]
MALRRDVEGTRTDRFGREHTLQPTAVAGKEQSHRRNVDSAMHGGGRGRDSKRHQVAHVDRSMNSSMGSLGTSVTRHVL